MSTLGWSIVGKDRADGRSSIAMSDHGVHRSIVRFVAPSGTAWGGASLAGEPSGIGQRCRGMLAAVDCCGRAIRALCAPNKKTAKRCAVAVSFLCPKHGR
jgi:hypothetical protein